MKSKMIEMNINIIKLPNTFGIFVLNQIYDNNNIHNFNYNTLN